MPTFEMMEVLGDEDMRRWEPCVLTLNLDGNGGMNDAELSLFEESVPFLIIILCLAVRSKTFFSVKGKYSVKWVVMSSLGGR